MIILDEPINGLDPQGIVEVRKTLETLRDEKKITIMISSHILDELGKLADKYGIIHEGRLMDEFTVDQLHERCGQFVMIRTNNDTAAVKVLGSAGFKNIRIDENGDLRVSEQLEKSHMMAKAVVNAGLELRELFVRNVSLEDYYLSVTGGDHNG